MTETVAPRGGGGGTSGLTVSVLGSTDKFYTNYANYTHSTVAHTLPHHGVSISLIHVKCEVDLALLGHDHVDGVTWQLAFIGKSSGKSSIKTAAQ